MYHGKITPRSDEPNDSGHHPVPSSVFSPMVSKSDECLDVKIAFGESWENRDMACDVENSENRSWEHHRTIYINNILYHIYIYIYGPANFPESHGWRHRRDHVWCHLPELTTRFSRSKKTLVKSSLVSRRSWTKQLKTTYINYVYRLETSTQSYPTYNCISGQYIYIYIIIIVFHYLEKFDSIGHSRQKHSPFCQGRRSAGVESLSSLEVSPIKVRHVRPHGSRYYLDHLEMNFTCFYPLVHLHS